MCTTTAKHTVNFGLNFFKKNFFTFNKNVVEQNVKFCGLFPNLFDKQINIYYKKKQKQKKK